MPKLQTGGADGADSLFAKHGVDAGHNVIHFTFDGHKKIRAPGDQLILTEEELAISEPYLKLANKQIKRTIPPQHTSVYKLLARNYYQIKDSQFVYAVAPLQNEMILGGTAWAVQMAINQNIPVALFDIFTNEWLMHGKLCGWHSVGCFISNRFPEVYTGIGSRNLTREAEKAIVELYQ